MRFGSILGRSAAAVAVAAAFAGFTATEASSSQPIETERHCVVVLDKLQPGQSDSRVVSRHCASSPEAAQRLRTAESPSSSATTLLLMIYADIDYGGGSTALEGTDGPCDTSGYGIRQLEDEWKNRVSSFKRFNWCQVVTGFDNINYGGASFGPWRVDTPWVGASANDRIESFRVRKA